MRPREPHIGGRVAFITDGRAISYAESVMGLKEEGAKSHNGFIHFMTDP